MPSSSDDMEQIRSWIRFACEVNGVPELAEMIVVEWNNRFTRKLADALHSPSRNLARIRLSIPLWPRATEQQRRDTVIHETCHVIVFRQYPTARSHGSEWKEAMLNCGVEPVPSHSVDRTGLIRRQRRFVLVDCPQTEKCGIGTRIFARLKRGEELWCKKCGLKLDRKAITEEEEEDTHKELPLFSA